MPELHDLAIVARVALAAALGGVIGLERELSGKPAGLRTHMLVAASAALITALARVLLALFLADAPGQSVRTDPTRILEAIVVGISFVGSGMIVFHRDSHQVEGLTTAASILMVAGLGVAVAAERAVLAICVTGLVVAIVLGVGALERQIGRWRERKK